jgi:hypothetical protein
MSRSSSSAEADLASGIVLAGAVIAAIVIGACLWLTWALITELFKTFRDHGFRPSATRRVLWIALSLLLGVWLLAGILLSMPSMAALGAYAGSWSLLLFTGTVLACDLWERVHQPKPATDLDQVLVPWPSETPARSA